MKLWANFLLVCHTQNAGGLVFWLLFLSIMEEEHNKRVHHGLEEHQHRWQQQQLPVPVLSNFTSSKLPTLPGSLNLDSPSPRLPSAYLLPTSPLSPQITLSNSLLPSPPSRLNTGGGHIASIKPQISTSARIANMGPQSQFLSAPINSSVRAKTTTTIYQIPIFAVLICTTLSRVIHIINFFSSVWTFCLCLTS